MKTHPGREPIGRAKNKDLGNLIFPSEEVPNESRSGDKAILQGVSVSAAEKGTKDIHQSASSTTIPRHNSEFTARDRSAESHTRIIATILDMVLIGDSTNTSSGPKTLAAIANVGPIQRLLPDLILTNLSGSIAPNPPTKMSNFHEKYNSVFTKEACAISKVKEVEDKRSAIKAKLEDLKNQDIFLA